MFFFLPFCDALEFLNARGSLILWFENNFFFYDFFFFFFFGKGWFCFFGEGLVGKKNLKRGGE